MPTLTGSSAIDIFIDKERPDNEGEECNIDRGGECACE